MVGWGGGGGVKNECSLPSTSKLASLASLWCCMFQVELQKDFDTVQSMLDEKEREMEALTKELLDSRSLPEGSDVSVSCFLFCFAFSLHFSSLHRKSKLLC